MVILPITITYSHPFIIDNGEITHEKIFRGYTSLESLNIAILKWITNIQDNYSSEKIQECPSCSESKD